MVVFCKSLFFFDFWGLRKNFFDLYRGGVVSSDKAVPGGFENHRELSDQKSDAPV